MSLPQGFKAELVQVLAPDRVADAPETLWCHSCDATNAPLPPDVVAFPETEAEVSALMAICHRWRVPVTPRGAGVGFSGGCVPARGGLVLVLTRMNRILEIDLDNLVAVVEPGVITQALQDRVRRDGLFYPPDPASVKSSTLGGNVAECAGGLSAVKYGVTKHYVLGLRFVLPDGRVGEYGGKIVKNVAGYDLIGLLVGSEGTLAVITRLTLKLLPLPEARRTLLVSFDGVERAGECVSRIIRARIIPTALELMDRASLTAVDELLHFGLPAGTDTLLLVEVDGKPADLAEDARRLLQVVGGSGGHVVLEASEEAERERIWEFRRSVSPAINRLGNLKINEDVVVPRSEVPRVIRLVEEVARRRRLRIVSFGHAGDGNLHLNIMVDRAKAPEVARAHRAVEEILRAVVAMGGAISGEHGIGLTKRDYLALNLTPEVIEVSRAIKRAFDPKELLNPGKIFPDLPR